MDATSASRTSMMAAVGRGMHRQLHAPPWVLDDAYALPLVGPGWPDFLAIFDRVLPGHLQELAFAFLVARSRYAEDRLEAGGFSQYVLLGAGLDSLAWRRPDLLRQVKVFEVDHPNTQAWKRERAAAIGLPEHEGHVFAPVNFETEELREALDRAGFDWSRPALFSWLGVVMYLTRDAIATTLRTLAGAASGSGTVLTYRPAVEYLDAENLTFLQSISPTLAQMGEPFLDAFAPAEFEALVRDCGHIVDENLAPEDLAARYFADRKDGLRPYSIERILSASLP
ncbi:MAG TPA: SAM-dependent methyltransferase [Acidimicrobiia bacterium]|nr:SAM-dependent methyltransferase [Acidimicrobiia bacterium]